MSIRTFFAGFVVAFGLGAVGCSREMPRAPQAEAQAPADPNVYPNRASPLLRLVAANDQHLILVFFFTDPDTGCDYVIYDGYKNGGITPRLRRGGSLAPQCGAPSRE